jgi:hypothetical protein
MSMKMLAGVLMALLVPGLGAGQEKDKPKPDDPRTVTKWVSEVQKPGFDNNDWEELGKYDTYDEAVARSTKWSKEHPGSLRLCREREIKVRLAPPDPGSKTPGLVENSSPKSGGITKPNLPTVDPGAMKLGGSKVASVAGKTGTGTIGTSKVSIKFTGKDGKGKFVVSGELEGEGEWQQDGSGVVMETALSKFRGAIRGDKLTGVRFTKKAGEDGKNALTEWSVTVTDTPKGESVAGTKWSFTSELPDGTNYRSSVSFEANGKYTSLQDGKPAFSGTWKEVKDEVLIQAKYKNGRGPYNYKAKRQGDTLKQWKVENDGRLSPLYDAKLVK